MAKKLDLKAAAQANDFTGMQQKAEDATAKQFTKAAFKKPNSDYLRLDLVVRDTTHTGTCGKPKMIEKVRADYKTYIEAMSGLEKISMTKYIHKLIEMDMERNKNVYADLMQIRKKKD